MTKPVETINTPSSKIRAAFGGWLQSEWRSGARLIVLEGLRGAGKTTLTKLPFSVDARKSVNISIDNFCRDVTPLKFSYSEAVDQSALRKAMPAKLGSASPLVVVEGPVAWPLIEPIVAAEFLERDCVRRVYLKRMMHLKPDFWVDGDLLENRDRWRPTGFDRSIYSYHEQRPWFDADLVLERVETAAEHDAH
jgi:hypothetical protein